MTNGLLGFVKTWQQQNKITYFTVIYRSHFAFQIKKHTSAVCIMQKCKHPFTKTITLTLEDGTKGFYFAVWMCVKSLRYTQKSKLHVRQAKLWLCFSYLQQLPLSQPSDQMIVWLLMCANNMHVVLYVTQLWGQFMVSSSKSFDSRGCVCNLNYDCNFSTRRSELSACNVSTF